MIVNSLSLPKNKEPVFSVEEEVLLNIEGGKSRRWLLPTALTLMANCMMLGLKFECRTMDQELIASADAEQVNALPTVIAALAQLRPLLDTIMASAKNEMAAEYQRQLVALAESSFAAGRASVSTGGDSAAEGKTMIVADGTGTEGLPT